MHNEHGPSGVNHQEVAYLIDRGWSVERWEPRTGTFRVQKADFRIEVWRVRPSTDPPDHAQLWSIRGFFGPERIIHRRGVQSDSMIRTLQEIIDEMSIWDVHRK